MRLNERGSVVDFVYCGSETQTLWASESLTPSATSPQFQDVVSKPTKKGKVLSGQKEEFFCSLDMISAFVPYPKHQLREEEASMQNKQTPSIEPRSIA